MRTGLLVILLCWSKLHYGQAQDTVKVFFDLDIPYLNNTAMHHLDSLAYYDKLPVTEKYGIIGYADYLGTDDYNITLSQNRANAVKEYLKGLGIADDLIATVIGKGEIARDMDTKDGYPTDRRVDVIIGGFKTDTAVTVKKKPKVVIVNKTPKATKEIDITKVKKNDVINLEHIFFLPGRHVIRESSFESLFGLYVTMRNNPTLKINIEGHICCLKNTTGDGYDFDTNEFKLSHNRAKAVYDYLTSKGVDASRMSYEGFGISRPLVWPERSIADENMNRRVELRILEK